MNIETFTDRLTDDIIDYAKASGVELTVADVRDISIYTLHAIISASSDIEIDSIRKSVCEIVGNESKIAEYLLTTIAGISATNDAIIDEKFAYKQNALYEIHESEAI